VNLGIGIPTLVADFIEPDSGIILHTENGMLGVGPAPSEGGALDYPVNAGKIPVTAVPGKPLLGVGGAMDLASGARRLIVTMIHASPSGASKLVPACTLPLTARGVVDTVITDLGVFKFREGQLRLVEIMPGASLEEIRSRTAAPFVEALERG
jgi:3-oxoacid CoA-transferase